MKTRWASSMTSSNSRVSASATAWVTSARESEGYGAGGELHDRILLNGFAPSDLSADWNLLRSTKRLDPGDRGFVDGYLGGARTALSARRFSLGPTSPRLPTSRIPVRDVLVQPGLGTEIEPAVSNSPESTVQRQLPEIRR